MTPTFSDILDAWKWYVIRTGDNASFLEWLKSINIIYEFKDNTKEVSYINNTDKDNV